MCAVTHRSRVDTERRVTAQRARLTRPGCVGTQGVPTLASNADQAAIVFGEPDPSDADTNLDRMLGEAVKQAQPAYQVIAGREGATFEV